MSSRPSKHLILAVAVALGPPLAPSAAAAQQVGVAAHVGTLGLGADVAVRLAPSLGVRAGANYFPAELTIDEDSVEYTFDLPSPQFLLLLDYYPVGYFRLSGGVMISTKDLEVTGELAEPVEIGNTTYTPEEVGTLTGTVDTRNLALYAGIGFGDPSAHPLGFFLDLGLAFHGSPELDVAAEGPVASHPDFQEDLEAEIEEREDDIDSYVAYPVLSIGLSFRVR